MRLTRIMIAIAAGFTLLGVPTAAGAAEPVTPQPSIPVTPTAEPTFTPQPSYPPTGPSLTSPDPSVTLGDPVTLIGNGFGPGEIVRLTFSLLPTAARLPGAEARPYSGGSGAMAPVALTLPTQLPQPVDVVADANGHFQTSVVFNEAGSILVTATGLTTGRVATLVVTVSAGQPPVSQSPVGQPPLPVTGSDVGSQITIGVASVLVGVLLVLLAIVWRRRHSRGGAGSRELESVR